MGRPRSCPPAQPASAFRRRMTRCASFPWYAAVTACHVLFLVCMSYPRRCSAQCSVSHTGAPSQLPAAIWLGSRLVPHLAADDIGNPHSASAHICARRQRRRGLSPAIINALLAIVKPHACMHRTHPAPAWLCRCTTFLSYPLRKYSFFVQIIVTFLSQITDACHSLSRVVALTYAHALVTLLVHPCRRTRL